MTYAFPDIYLEEDTAVLGRKGGGKTFTSKGIVERLLDLGRRVLVLDPLGVWAGLRSAADGNGPGYPVAIIGGQHADLPLEPAAAVPMAEVIARNNVPAVLDISELSKSAQQSFLLAFLRELRRLNTEALTLVLEEADVFAPQNPMGDDSKALHAEIDWIARRGRFRGFRLITITQRPARLSKDVLTQAATLIMHRLPAPQDRDAVKAWVDGNGDRDQSREVFDTLARLDVGEAWVWSTVDNTLGRQRFPRIKTLDTSATPKAGEKRIEPKTLAEVDLSPIRAAMEAARAEVPTKATAKASVAVDQRAIEQAEQRGYLSGIASGRRHIASVLHDLQGAVAAAVAEAERLCDKAFDEAWPRTPLPSDPAAPAVPVVPRPKPVDIPKPAPAAARAAGGGGLDGAARGLLGAFARYAEPLTWDDACIVAGMASGNGYFYRGRKVLLDGGYVEESGAAVSITSQGRQAAGIAVRPLALAEIVSIWTAKVGAPGSLMLTHLAARGERWTDTDDLSRAIGAKSGNGYWYRGVKSLRGPGLIEQQSGSFRISAFLRRAE
ncbi:helicase HerA-like domain-containing protein [Klebsiella pneumoniae]